MVLIAVVELVELTETHIEREGVREGEREREHEKGFERELVGRFLAESAPLHKI